jgi:hypothetical protein
MNESFDDPPGTDDLPEQERGAWYESIRRQLGTASARVSPLPPPPTEDDLAEKTREAEESRREQEHRAKMERWRDVMRRQPLLRAAGELHPGVAPWAARLGRNEPPGNLVLAGPYLEGKTWNALHAVLSAYMAMFDGYAEYVNLQKWREARPASKSKEQLFKGCGILPVVLRAGPRQRGNHGPLLPPPARHRSPPPHRPGGPVTGQVAARASPGRRRTATGAAGPCGPSGPARRKHAPGHNPSATAVPRTTGNPVPRLPASARRQPRRCLP